MSADPPSSDRSGNGPGDADRLSRTLESYRDRGVGQVKIALADIDGVHRGKYVSLEKFQSLMEKGGGFCDCVFGWDVDDQLYDESVYTGWHTGFPDTGYRLIAESERWLEDESGPLFVGEFAGPDGGDHPLCPRTRLRGVLDRLAARGYQTRSGFEYEFFVFEETPGSVRERGYRNLTPLSPGNFGYSVLRASHHSDLFTGLLQYCRDLDVSVEGLHCETGPGVWEAAMAASDGVAAADRASLFKTFCKVFFNKRDKMATFMAKWSMDYPGQSGHYHFSLLDGAGANVFFDAATDRGISGLQQHAVAGLQRYLPELLVMLAPTVNSYTRLVKGAWAPTAATWGIENRTAGIRVIPGGAGSQRIECRVGGADGNPYLAGAAVLGAAALGIEAALTPTEPVSGNAYDLEDSLPGEMQFPGNLRDATARFEGSAAARELFGDAFVEHFAMTRYWECREYERHVNDWQLGRYFEII